MHTSCSAQHLPLASAAAVVYLAVSGRPPGTRSTQEIDASLNRVAHAIASVTTIYVFDPFSGGVRELTPREVLYASFERGATVLKTLHGTEYRRLTMHRADLDNAITILSRVRGSILSPCEA
jgi:hypothetical protein